MNVLSCNRSECENIMCDRYCSEYGHICDRCFKELVALGVTTNINEFMQTRPNDNIDATEAYFAVIFEKDQENNI